jgi:hypothetical protein
MNEFGFRAAMAPTDRILCTLGGSMLLSRGLGLLVGRHRFVGGVIALTGSALLARGAMATSAPVRHVRVVRTQPAEPQAGVDTVAEVMVEPGAEPAAPAAYDRVDEASDESFPASDAPSWTSSGVGAPRHESRERPRREPER